MFFRWKSPRRNGASSCLSCHPERYGFDVGTVGVVFSICLPVSPPGPFVFLLKIECYHTCVYVCVFHLCVAGGSQEWKNSLSETLPD